MTQPMAHQQNRCIEILAVKEVFDLLLKIVKLPAHRFGYNTEGDLA